VGSRGLPDREKLEKSLLVRVDAIVDVVAVAVGDGFYVVALKKDGTIWDLQYNEDDQFGDATQVKGLPEVQTHRHPISMENQNTDRTSSSFQPTEPERGSWYQNLRLSL
jgi:alpha-tubulin suppressor-like RCC1 family protein